LTSGVTTTPIPVAGNVRTITYTFAAILAALTLTACGDTNPLAQTSGPSAITSAIARADKAAATAPALIIWGEKLPGDKTTADNIMWGESAPTATTQNIMWGD
jgi:hypothetical protein